MAIAHNMIEHAPPANATRFVVDPSPSALRPGFDPGALNRLVDDLEDEVIQARLAR